MALTAKKVYAILKRQISDMEAKLNSPVRYKGTVATADLLPLNPDIGDMYNIESKSVYGEAGMNVAWNGVVWDTMGAPIDMSLYLTKEEAEAVIQRLVTEYFEKNPVKPGATTEQAQQIEQNKKDVASLKTETNSLKEDISNKITKFYASSQGETHLADSDNGKIMDMMVYGQSKQAVTTGAQLLGSDTVFVRNTDDVSVTTNNPYEVSWTHNTNVPIRGVYSNNAKPILANKQYIISFDARFSDGNSHNIRCVDTDKTCVNGRNSILIGIHEKNSVVSFYTLGKITEGLSVTISNIMLEEGSTPHDFEPYTGGIPSPNPDYPQEIKSVVNPKVKVCGKNLFRPLMPTTTVNGVTVTNNGNGTYTLNGTAIGNETFRLDQLSYAGTGNLNKYKGTYTLSRSDTSYEARVMQHDTWKLASFLSIGSKKDTKEINLDNCFIFISVSKGKTYNNVLVDLQFEVGSTATAFEPYHEQTITLPYTLNAIPVSSGGNVTIDGQQYIADYVDVERGKLVRMVDTSKLDSTQSIVDKTEWLLAEPQEIDLTQEEVQAFKALTTYYPATNISVNSEQLDGYTVFNYPISMENGWNYVKQQIGDTRDYIYDMDARTQDTDLQAAEAYVNSEYAVALTELEV